MKIEDLFTHFSASIIYIDYNYEVGTHAGTCMHTAHHTIQRYGLWLKSIEIIYLLSPFGLAYGLFSFVFL